MSEPYVVASQSGAVRTLTMSRPSMGNRFDEDMCTQMLRALEAAAADSAVRCLTLTGGRPVFSIGEDLAKLIDSPQKLARRPLSKISRVPSSAITIP